MHHSTEQQYVYKAATLPAKSFCMTPAVTVAVHENVPHHRTDVSCNAAGSLLKADTSHCHAKMFEVEWQTMNFTACLWIVV